MTHPQDGADSHGQGDARLAIRSAPPNAVWLAMLPFSGRIDRRAQTNLCNLLRSATPPVAAAVFGPRLHAGAYFRPQTR